MPNHNSFPEVIHEIFQQAWECWFCGMNTADSLHHVVGRGQGDSWVEGSILNAAPLCNQKCHLPNHGKLRTKEWIAKLLNTTYLYLVSIRYEFEEIDYEFIEKYKEYYI